MSQLKTIERYDVYRSKVMDDSGEFRAVVNGVHVLMEEKMELTSTVEAENIVMFLMQDSIIREQKKYLAESKLFNGASKLHLTKEVAEQYARGFTDIDELISQGNSTAPRIIEWLRFTDPVIKRAWKLNSPLDVTDENLRELLPLFESFVVELIEKNFDEDDLGHDEAAKIVSISITAMGANLFTDSKRKQMAQCSKFTNQLKIGLDVVRDFITKELPEYHQLILDSSKSMVSGSGDLTMSRAERASLIRNLTAIKKKSYWIPVWYSFTDNYYKDLHQEQNITDLYISLQAEDIVTGSINDLGWSSCHGASVGSSAFNLATNRVTFVVYARSESNPIMKNISLPGRPVDNKRLRFYVHLYEEAGGKVWFAVEHAYPLAGYTWAHKAILGLLHELYPNLHNIETQSALVFGGTPEDNLKALGIYGSGYYDYVNDVYGALTYYNLDLFKTPYIYDDGTEYILGEGLFNVEYNILLDQGFPTLSEGVELSEVVYRTGSESTMTENWIFVKE